MPKKPYDVFKLVRTISTTKRSWCHLGHDGRIYFANQRNGQESTGTVYLTPAEFRQFVKFYDRAVKLSSEV